MQGGYRRQQNRNQQNRNRNQGPVIGSSNVHFGSRRRPPVRQGRSIDLSNLVHEQQAAIKAKYEPVVAIGTGHVASLRQLPLTITSTVNHIA